MSHLTPMRPGIPECYRDNSAEIHKSLKAKKKKSRRTKNPLRFENRRQKPQTAPKKHSPVLNYNDRNQILKAAFGGIDYSAYLKSDLWYAIRALVLTRSPQCCRCGKTANQVHHSSYAEEVLRGFWTKPLWPVCKTCHDFAEINPDGSKRFDIQEVNRILSAKIKQPR